MLNLTIADNGGTIVDYSSQYHHESRVSNLSSRNSTLVWFSHITQLLPQHVTFQLNNHYLLRRVGIYLHGENNQNPKHIQIFFGNSKTESHFSDQGKSNTDVTQDIPESGDSSTSTSKLEDSSSIGQNESSSPQGASLAFNKEKINWVCVVDSTLEHRAGDHLFDIEYPLSPKTPVTTISSGPSKTQNISNKTDIPKFQYVKYVITENFGGSGIFVSKCYAFGDI